MSAIASVLPVYAPLAVSTSAAPVTATDSGSPSALTGDSGDQTGTSSEQTIVATNANENVSSAYTALASASSSIIRGATLDTST